MQLRLAIPDLLHSKKIKNVLIYWALRNNLYKENIPDFMYFVTRKEKIKHGRDKKIQDGAPSLGRSSFPSHG
jgi:hypothetical protein